MRMGQKAAPDTRTELQSSGMHSHVAISVFPSEEIDFDPGPEYSNGPCYSVSGLIRDVGVVLRRVRGCGLPASHCHTISHATLLTFYKMKST